MPFFQQLIQFFFRSLVSKVSPVHFFFFCITCSLCFVSNASHVQYALLAMSHVFRDSPERGRVTDESLRGLVHNSLQALWLH